MHRTVAAYQVKDTIDQRISAKVPEFPQRGAVAQMTFTIGVASRTTQRAVASDLNGKQRNISAQNAPPGTCKIAGSKTGRENYRLHCHLEMNWWFGVIRRNRPEIRGLRTSGRTTGGSVTSESSKSMIGFSSV
jgi:hypothetical protein